MAVFEDPGDLDRKASIASERSSSETEAARGPGRPVFLGGISTPSKQTHFPLSFLSAWKFAQA